MAAITARQPASWDEDALAELRGMPVGSASDGTASSSYNPTPGGRKPAAIWRKTV